MSYHNAALARVDLEIGNKMITDAARAPGSFDAVVDIPGRDVA